MASIWKGSLAFGLVNIPIELRSAVREDHIKFRLLHEDDLSPVKYERICQTENEPIPWSEIVKGYEYKKGKFVVITDEDFEKAALTTSHSVDILDFVKEDEIDPRYFDMPYYIVPSKGGEKAYALLRDAIVDREAVGIGKIIIRQKQHLAAIKAVGTALTLEIMRFANELVDPSEYSFPKAHSGTPQERKMATQLIDSLTSAFDPKKYTDEYRANLMRVINAKLKGKKVHLKEPEGPEQDDDVIDLMARLKQSLATKRGGRSTTRPRKTATRTRRTTTKTASRTHRKSA